MPKCFGGPRHGRDLDGKGLCVAVEEGRAWHVYARLAGCLMYQGWTAKGMLNGAAGLEMSRRWGPERRELDFSHGG